MTKGVQIRVDEKLKKQAERIFSDMGIDMPTGIRIFLKKVVVTKSIPFPLTSQQLTENGFTEEFEKEVLKATQKDPQYGPFDTVDKMFQSLHKKKKR